MFDLLGFSNDLLNVIWHVLLPAGAHIAFLGFGGKKNARQQAQTVADDALNFQKLKGNDLWDRSRAQEDTANAGVQTGLQDYTNVAKQFTDPARFNRNQDSVESALQQYSGRVSGLYDHPGYTPQEQGAMHYSATAPIASSYAGANGDLMHRSAVTNNPQGYGAGMGQMARMRGADLAAASSGVTDKVADARRADQQTAIGMSQFPVAQRQQLIEGDRSMVDKFQFPAALNSEMLQGAMNTQTANRGVDAGVGMNQSQLAYNPSQSGLWGQIFKNMMSKITSNSSGMGLGA